MVAYLQLLETLESEAMQELFGSEKSKKAELLQQTNRQITKRQSIAFYITIYKPC